MIKFTPTAIEKVNLLREEEKITEPYLRVGVKGGGCSGLRYDMYFTDELSEMDEVLDIGGIQVAVDPVSAQYLEETEVDYVEMVKVGSGFKFNNPQMKTTCGCGSSFSV